MYRAAGGRRAIVTSIHVDLRPEGLRGDMGSLAKVNLYCNAVEARDRLKRLEDAGFDDAILYCPEGDLSQLQDIRALMP